MNNKKTEKKTGDLYSDCFSKLKDDEWFYQGKVLADLINLQKNDVEGKVCLDGGCGHGALTWQISEKGAKITYGVDLKPAPKENKFVGKESIKFVSSSLLSLPFSDNFFDFVVSTGVIHHTIDPQKGIAELARVLKPSGKIIIGVYGKHGIFPYVLSFVRFFTVKIPIIPKRIIDKLIAFLKFSPMLRYQVLDYLYVPVLKRYSPKEVRGFLVKNGIDNCERVLNLSAREAKEYRRKGTVYTYDPRTFLSKLIFGYGFIVVSGKKSR